MSEHWCNEVFVDNAEFYCANLSRLISEASMEAAWIAKCLRILGVETKSSRVLDLGCGIGRHACQLASMGFNITGLDLSPRAIQCAEQTASAQDIASRASFVVGDMRRVQTLFPAKHFDAVMSLFTSFGYYEDETNLLIAAGCRAVVKEGGFLIVDTMNRDWLAANFVRHRVSEVGDFVFIEDMSFDVEDGRIHSDWTVLREVPSNALHRVAKIHVDHRVYNYHELKSLMYEAGWVTRSVYSGLRDEPFCFRSPRITAVFEAA